SRTMATTSAVGSSCFKSKTVGPRVQPPSDIRFVCSSLDHSRSHGLDLRTRTRYGKSVGIEAVSRNGCRKGCDQAQHHILDSCENGHPDGPMAISQTEIDNRVHRDSPLQVFGPVTGRLVPRFAPVVPAEVFCLGVSRR